MTYSAFRSFPTARARSIRWLATLAVGVGLLTGCAAPGPGVGSTGYVTGAGGIVTTKPPDRKPAPPLSGQTLSDSRFSLQGHLGKVVVLNVWASWCPPCRAESAGLVAAANRLPGAVFLGIDTRDDRSAARAFVRSHHVPYPSLFDPNGTAMLRFYGVAAADSLPTTIVIDPRGRIAAVISGKVTTTTLVDLVHSLGGRA